MKHSHGMEYIEFLIGSLHFQWLWKRRYSECIRKIFTTEHIFPLDVRESLWKDVSWSCAMTLNSYGSYQMTSLVQWSDEGIKKQKKNHKKTFFLLPFIIKTCWWLKVVVTFISFEIYDTNIKDYSDTCIQCHYLYIYFWWNFCRIKKWNECMKEENLKC